MYTILIIVLLFILVEIYLFFKTPNKKDFLIFVVQLLTFAGSGVFVGMIIAALLPVNIKPYTVKKSYNNLNIIHNNEFFVDNKYYIFHNNRYDVEYQKTGNKVITVVYNLPTKDWYNKFSAPNKFNHKVLVEY